MCTARASPRRRASSSHGVRCPPRPVLCTQWPHFESVRITICHSPEKGQVPRPSCMAGAGCRTQEPRVRPDAEGPSRRQTRCSVSAGPLPGVSARHSRRSSGLFLSVHFCLNWEVGSRTRTAPLAMGYLLSLLTLGFPGALRGPLHRRLCACL